MLLMALYLEPEGLTMQELMAVTKSRRATQRNLDWLVHEGYIRREEEPTSGRPGTYRHRHFITEKGRAL